MNVAVIGGGASGMTVCASALKKHNITLFEKNPRVGKKLLVTGNGRCNMTNADMDACHFHGEDPFFCRSVLEKYGRDCTLEFFRNIGLVTVNDGGRIYPLSDSANSVVDSLRLYISNNGVDIKTGCEVTDIACDGNGFLIEADRKYHFDRVVIAAGGIAGGKYGGSESGYRLAQKLGHTRTKLYPSLVQIKTDNTFTKSLKGVRADARIELAEGKNIIAQSAGEIQFTDYGISGPAVFEISRAAAMSKGSAVRLDLMRGYSKDDIVAILQSRQDYYSTETLENLLTGILHNRLGRTVLRYCGYHLDEAVACLNSDDMEDIADGIKNFVLAVTGDLGFENAQVTAGGLKTCEFDSTTLESKLAPGLYATGEVLDIDGDCGGYNLQWAWSSGLAVGNAL